MNKRTQLNHSETIEEELAAYFDGELDAETSSKVEQRLAEDAEYRHQLQQLERAWDLLDFLPRARIGEEFTQTTVEMVAVKAANEVRKRQAFGTFPPALVWAASAAGILLAALLGYGITSRIVSAPNRQLVRDLPVIQNVDLYNNVESIEFLRLLDQSGLFTSDVEEVEHES